MVRVGVLGLQGNVVEHIATLQRLNCEVIQVRGKTEFDQVDALIIPGGESTTLGMLLQSSGLDKVITDAISQGMPVLGTCAGMILLADEVVDGKPGQFLLGGIDISVRRNAFGRQLDSFEACLEVTGIAGGPVNAVFIRAPIVERTGPLVDVLAYVDKDNKKMPVVCRQGNVMVTSFHPEIVEDDRIHAMIVEMVHDKAVT